MLALSLSGPIFCFQLPALAQKVASYPSETIRIVVPFGPAGGPDFSVRALQAVLQEAIKQPVRVENRPGANSIIGTRAVATAAPDGYTLLGASSGFSTIAITTSQPGFDPLKDFAPVSLTARAAGYLLVVSAKSPFNTMADLIAGARKSEIFYGSPGLGNTLHLVAALFASRAGASFKHVPYPNLPTPCWRRREARSGLCSRRRRRSWVCCKAGSCAHSVMPGLSRCRNCQRCH